MSKAILTVLVILNVIFVVHVMMDSTNLPEVRWSHQSKQCVEVIEFTSVKKGWTCENLPRRFDKVWVK